MGNFTKTAIAINPDKLTFLDLPTELRFKVYEYFTPEDQYVFDSGEPVYDGLLRTCKQIRTEALKEIQKAADKYYRAYETRWLLTEGFSIKVEPIIDPEQAVVVFSEDHFMSDACRMGRRRGRYQFHIPLATLKLKRLSFRVSRNSDTSPPHLLGCVPAHWAITQLLMSILKSNPQAQRIYFHRDRLNCGFGYFNDDFGMLCTLVEEESLRIREQEERNAPYEWQVTTNRDYSTRTVLGIWLDRVTHHLDSVVYKV
ncbi:unnamed protein product [Alternaria alternata]